MNQEHSPTPSEFLAVAKLDEIPADRGKSVQVKGRVIALFRGTSGEIHAMDDVCPHTGAPLSDGHVCDDIVICPWHAWRFRVTDGLWADAPSTGTRVRSYETRVDGEVVALSVDW